MTPPLGLFTIAVLLQACCSSCDRLSLVHSISHIMQYVELSLSHLHFHCPITGKAILDPNGYDAATSSVVALWIGFGLGDPEIHDQALENAWSAWAEETGDMEGNMPAFLQAYNGGANWVAYRLADPNPGPFSVGPVWLVLDYDAVHSR
jgi:hypothetical protein